MMLKGKTVGNLFDFLVQSADRGDISQSLSAHLRAAVKKIFLATCPPEEFWRDVPLGSVNLSERIETLRKNNRGECSEETIRVYEKRYERSLKLYLESLPPESSSVSSPSRQSSRSEPSPRPKSDPKPAPPEASALEQLLFATSLSAKTSLMTLLTSDDVLDNYRVFAAAPNSPEPVAYFVLPKHLSPAELEQLIKNFSPLLHAQPP